jgi:hypothetical protein
MEYEIRNPPQRRGETKGNLMRIVKISRRRIKKLNKVSGGWYLYQTLESLKDQLGRGTGELLPKGNNLTKMQTWLGGVDLPCKLTQMKKGAVLLQYPPYQGHW